MYAKKFFENLGCLLHIVSKTMITHINKLHGILLPLLPKTVAHVRVALHHPDEADKKHKVVKADKIDKMN